MERGWRERERMDRKMYSHDMLENRANVGLFINLSQWVRVSNGKESRELLKYRA